MNKIVFVKPYLEKVLPQAEEKMSFRRNPFSIERLPLIAKGFLLNGVLGDLGMAEALQKQKATACPCGRNRGRPFKTTPTFRF